MYLLPPEFETERLYIDYYNQAIFPQWLPFFKDREDLMHLGLDMTKSDEQLCREWILRQMGRYPKGHGSILLYTKSDRKLIGNIGLLLKEIAGEQIVEIGYSSLKTHRGHGYISEAAIAVRDYAFQNTDVERLHSVIGIGNTPSQKVAERNGMQKGREFLIGSDACNLWYINRKDWEIIKQKEE